MDADRWKRIEPIPDFPGSEPNKRGQTYSLCTQCNRRAAFWKKGEEWLCDECHDERKQTGE